MFSSDLKHKKRAYGVWGHIGCDGYELCDVGLWRGTFYPVFPADRTRPPHARLRRLMWGNKLGPATGPHAMGDSDLFYFIIILFI